MNGWRVGGMRRIHDFGVSCVIRRVSGALVDSQVPKFRTEMQPLVDLGIRRIEFSGHTGKGPQPFLVTFEPSSNSLGFGG